jgi:cell wall-associated NlpC family hydrolase
MDYTIIRERIVAAARTQKGVPYRKDTHIPNVAIDCVGLLRHSIYEATGFVIPSDSIKQGHIVTFTDMRLPRFLNQMGCRVRKTIFEAVPGDFIIWKYGPSIIHTGIVTEWKYPHAPQVIHSCAAFEKVVEHTAQGEWSPGRRFYGVYNIDGALDRVIT